MIPHSGAARLNALDSLRGLIMVLMALDHASGFISRVHPFEFWDTPLPNYNGGLWFLTRWVTHLCAPGFFLLMGAGMVLFADSRRAAGWSEAQITRHLVTRGFLLIPIFYLLELPIWVWNDILNGGPPWWDGLTPPALFMVLCTLGFTMAICAPLIRKELRLGGGFWLAVGVVAIAATNAVISQLDKNEVNLLLRIFVVPGFTPPVVTMYPILPWLGIAALGIACGYFLLRGKDRALRATLPVSIVLLLGYAWVRLSGGPGNIRIATDQGWIDWLAVVKYPPSIAFVLLTLGMNLLLVWIFYRTGGSRILSVFGQTPLFFYLAHLYVYTLMHALLFRTGAAPQWALYVCWLAGLALLYPVCLGYGRFKQARSAGSIWRMF